MSQACVCVITLAKSSHEAQAKVKGPGRTLCLLWDEPKSYMVQGMDPRPNKSLIYSRASMTCANDLASLSFGFSSVWQMAIIAVPIHMLLVLWGIHEMIHVSHVEFLASAQEILAEKKHPPLTSGIYCSRVWIWARRLLLTWATSEMTASLLFQELRWPGGVYESPDISPDISHNGWSYRIWPSK